jgi:hypothetical protein
VLISSSAFCCREEFFSRRPRVWPWQIAGSVPHFGRGACRSGASTCALVSTTLTSIEDCRKISALLREESDWYPDPG